MGLPIQSTVAGVSIGGDIDHGSLNVAIKVLAMRDKNRGQEISPLNSLLLLLAISLVASSQSNNSHLTYLSNFSNSFLYRYEFF